MNEYKKKEKLDLGGKEGTKAFWEQFLGELAGEPHRGAVKELENCLGKYLPEGTELTNEEILRACKPEKYEND
jgi:hypothetical protein